MFETFEVHITGNQSILQAAKSFRLKTIAIELLKPNYSFLRTEYMTSHVYHQFKCFEDCYKHVEEVVEQLRDFTDILRVKIECPYYEHYVDQSCYIESHFVAFDATYPMSRNKSKTIILATDRSYNKEEYDRFTNPDDRRKAEIVELCLYDNHIEEDLDWMSLYV